ncbi:MAG: glycosyltransferase family 2 protein [Chloroflexota bacterium]
MTVLKRAAVLLLMTLQASLGLRVAWRLMHSGWDAPVRALASDSVPDGTVAILLPVLNEEHRLASCLDGLIAQGPEVAQILIVDGGSADATCSLARQTALRDPRVRLIEAGPAEDGWNGKVWGLAHGADAVHPHVVWLLTVDADVRLDPRLVRSLLAHAEARDLRMSSVATAQRAVGLRLAALHPALLTSLVYRFGRPNDARRDPAAVIANGQCCLIRRDVLDECGGFIGVRDSLCEDVSLARRVATAGHAIGFYEAPGLAEVTMYTSAGDAWRNWPRSLTTRDAAFGLAGWIGLLEVTCVQALPLILLLSRSLPAHLRQVNWMLLGLRLGTLVGTSRTYRAMEPTYWLSPLLDVPVAGALWRSAFQGDHVWRGRTYSRRKGMVVA